MEVEKVDSFLDNCQSHVLKTLDEVSENKQSRLLIYIDNLTNIEDMYQKKNKGLKSENLKIKIDYRRKFKDPLVGLSKENFLKNIFNSARELLKSKELPGFYRLHEARLLCILLGIEKNIYSNWM